MSLDTLVRLGLARAEGILLVPDIDPLRRCIRELMELTRKHDKLGYAKQRLLEDPLNVTSNIVAYCLLRRLAEAKIELDSNKLAKLTSTYLTILWESRTLLFLEEELIRLIEEVEGKALNQPRCNHGS